MKLRMGSPEEGARTPVYCATSPAVANETDLLMTSAASKCLARRAEPATRRRTMDAQRGVGVLTRQA